MVEVGSRGCNTCAGKNSEERYPKKLCAAFILAASGAGWVGIYHAVKWVTDLKL